MTKTGQRRCFEGAAVVAVMRGDRPVNFVKSAVAPDNSRAVPVKPALFNSASPGSAGLLEHFPAKWIPANRKTIPLN
jgi:hypothetical protein